MDQNRPAVVSRRRYVAAPFLEYLESRRLLAAIGARVSFREITTKGTTELLVSGTNKPDVINVNDDGTGNAGNVTIRLGDGTTYTSQAAISVIEVLGKGGNDQVTYSLNGNLNSPRSVLLDLGAGNDQFTAAIAGDINDSVGLDLEVYGDAGNDTMMIRQTGSMLSGTFVPYLDGGSGNDSLTYSGTGSIASGAALVPGLSGDAGNDTINANYSGQINGNYIYNLTISGGAGNDSISDVVNVAAGSSGTVGSSAQVPAVVEGGVGNDHIVFAVNVDPSVASSQVFAWVVGGPGKDTIQRTSSVETDRSNENDTMIS
jgi:serralysin